MHGHKADFAAFNKIHNVSKTPQEPSQPTLLQCGVFGRKQAILSKKRQKELDHDLALVLLVDNIPLNILRRDRFKKWVHVSILIFQIVFFKCYYKVQNCFIS